MYLYKVASRKRRERNFSSQAFLNGFVDTIPMVNAAGGMGSGIAKGHPAVGGILGPAALNGAMAKDEGVSYLPETMLGGAAGGALIGTAISPLLVGMLSGHYPASSIVAGSLAAGTLGGAAVSALHYGMGKTFGKNKKNNTKG
jgi:hypothetical protein